jgi:nifR3 family TIM-barrel protein
MTAIWPVPVSNCAFLAPMSGVSDLPFRRIAAGFGAGLVFSEMVASDRLVAGEEDARLRLEADGLLVRAVQLAGCTEHHLTEAARIAEAAGADLIDINMGCPAKRVVHGWAGSALMRDLDHATRLVRAVVAGVAVPVSLKMRLGWDEASVNAPELARRAEAEGVRMVTVHGRTRRQFYKGRADWGAIAAVKAAVSVPVVANGDCAAVADARDMLARSGADAVMIGRAAVGRPWLVGAIGSLLADGSPATASAASTATAAAAAPDPARLAGLVAGHYEAVLGHYGVAAGVRQARKHLAGYCDDALRRFAPAGSAVPNRVRSLKTALLTADDPARVMALLPAFFASCTETMQQAA